MKEKRPTILISNDDGVDSPGLKFITTLLSKNANVYVVAPLLPQSGMSHATTFRLPLRAKCLTETENLHIYSLEGTPVDCVKFAFDQLISPEKIDLLVSGINAGSNSANSIIYSGTVACAREGAINGIPSIAFSTLDYSSECNFDIYVPYIQKIVKTIMQQGLEKLTYLNVNFPRPELIHGMKVCHITKGLWIERFEKRTDPRHQTYYWLTGDYKNEDDNINMNDELALKQGFAAIVPIKVEDTNKQTIKRLESLNDL